MAAGGGETAALQAEVNELRLRVQELERENQRLAKIASSCCCGSKENNVVSSPVGSASLYDHDQGVQQNRKSHGSRSSDHDITMSFPADHMVTSSENEVLCNGNAGGDELPKIRSKCAKITGLPSWDFKSLPKATSCPESHVLWAQILLFCFRSPHGANS